MRLLVRLAALCLSVALLSGVLLHDLAGAKMSLDMANSVSMVDAEQDSVCPACTPEGPNVIVCDMDCTAPVFLTGKVSQSEPIAVETSFLWMPSDLDLAGLDQGHDPFPPRSTFLS
tara:strand:+ start:203 stop:550 length:348 start_codon:yes stop_codon:yes gene_type:complete